MLYKIVSKECLFNDNYHNLYTYNKQQLFLFVQ